ncbi:SDR family NAD(P)-dependent oxidoreductase [Trichocoleus sp. FACHB-262]|uniref:SDR family NAD(P)-dependent oxidoreductase n=1 Tax=Trichocoleus sp. FACHB-262 TaxID=2692869 RepID=UPI001684DBC6|nr:SDR family NAD(P)-dependent oxidoreductase [Trichocoleus sp. FACHB-262]MBD2123626.1 SDR family NAD(P)-dependent oxidoreductase [Trichocoleus sp. FACHB-262]
MSLELSLAGKTAIVTGGSAGIGFTIAKALYREGVSVAIAARNPERLEQAAQAIRELPNQGNQVLAIIADLSQAEGVDTVVSKTLAAFGQIDILYGFRLTVPAIKMRRWEES